MDRKDKAFQKLQKLWYGKLAKSGFEDIEQADGRLKIWHSHVFGIRSTNVKFLGAAREEYYRLAGQFLWEHKFAGKIERRMWELHANGICILDIAEKLTKEFSYIYKRKVHETLQKLSKEMLDNVAAR